MIRAIAAVTTIFAFMQCAWAQGNADAERQSVLRAQVLLDKAHFSPGPIDGRMGSNTRKAIAALQQSAGLQSDGRLTTATWRRLEVQEDTPTLVDYAITAEDIKGPFADVIPDTLKEMANLRELSYTSAEELLAEKFHMDIDLFKRLNKNKRLDQAGTTIRVANVERAKVDGLEKIEVDKALNAVRVLDKSGSILAYFPATVGSDDTPSPSGTVEVTRIVRNPSYTYDPSKLNFKGVEATERFTIAGGPNNPVGIIWIELSKESYGIHGSPDPAAISRQQSHGCVRLTNWDALDLAAMIRKGVQVQFVGDDSDRGQRAAR